MNVGLHKKAPAAGAARRRSLVLNEIAQDPCALDVIVWCASPVVPAVVDRLFEACASEDPPIRWALLGPREDQLRSLLMKLHASMPDVPLSLMHDAPIGCNPYIIPVQDGETDVFQKIVSRAILVLQASKHGMPSSLIKCCITNYIDVVDVVQPPTKHDDTESLTRSILEGDARIRGGVMRLGSSDPLESAAKALALIRAAAQLRGYAPHVCDGGQLCTSGMCSLGLRARL
mmetsp:Transcript_26030/g.41874  ORF Transcript_26030/g.41874 Transcript_26030/m.41874 type:complete len:231 (+) Transcript_26030:45-737(+)